MEKPTITISGKIFKPSSPKMKTWRKFLEFFEKSNEELKEMTLSEYTDSMLDLIQAGFDSEDLTAELIEENLNVSEVRQLTLELFTWLREVFFTGLEEIPKNADAAAET